jgi:2-polyprenyl-3-methyl-5-hydroxy-6-metoxy-1,4-benzoquinol methylase
MTEFWEGAFQEKQKMWGELSTASAQDSANEFKRLGFQKILIPGIGYGRNAKPFLDLGMEVTGIEISETAIAMGKQKFGDRIRWIQGSVTSMLFEGVKYDGVYCHALIHLLDTGERKKLIADCFGQLNAKGLMVFTAITKNSDTYSDALRNGTQVATDRFRTKHGVDLFFYDERSIAEEFGTLGRTEFSMVEEPVNNQVGSTTAFWKIICHHA